MPTMVPDPMKVSICPGCVKPIRPCERYEQHDKQNWHVPCLTKHIKGKEWEVNHIGSEKICPTCGHSLGFSGSTEDAISKQEKAQEPPPCGEMGVWSDEELDAQC